MKGRSAIDSDSDSAVAASRAGRSGIGRVLLVAGVGALLMGFAAFGASAMFATDVPTLQTMCLDSTCTFAMSADTGMPMQSPPKQHSSRSAPERFARKVLYICHIR